MFYARISDDENKYEKVLVEDRVFYRRKPAKGDPPSSLHKNTAVKRQKRYSDQFRDPVFEQKEIIRKLKMIANFKKKHGNLDSVIEGWRNCIQKCVNTLQEECDVDPKEIFKTFKLQEYGFLPEDFCIESDEEGEEDAESN